ncbi:MAG: 4-oxalocrotonate tautomerase family protein [Catenulispora sp.]|nr:4-oxalocrotonate tautomerase family protein [Catenulispora sp.]
MPFANFKVPAGTLDAAQKEKIIHRTTDLYAEIYGERARAGTMVLVEEVADGGWGIGDHVLTLALLTEGEGGGENEADASAGHEPGTSAGTDDSGS